MEVKAGYKQTDVGVIPEDWSAKPVLALCKLINGRGFKPHEWGLNGLPIIRIQNLNGSNEFNYYLGHYDPKILVENGQLLFAWSGSRGTSFGPHIWAGETALLNYHTWKLVIYPSEVRHDFYLYALKRLTSYIEKNAHGASALVHTQKWVMEKYKVAIPNNHAEQHAIANALSDVDQLIASIDQLIAKKRDLKQATMQQLLTGKTRLAGFSGEWVEMPLSKASWCQEGPGVRNTQFTTSGVKLLNGTNIVRGHLRLENTNRFISEQEAFGPYAHFMAHEGDIVIASSGITIDRLHEKVAVVQSGDLPFCMNTSTIRFKPIEQFVISSYLYHYLTSDLFKKDIGGYATGSAQLNYGPSHLKKIDILVPAREEQSAIADVLSDMDAELNELEQRRDKTITLKQGMMQELLTGKTRLI